MPIKNLIITGANTARETNELPQCKCKMYTNEFEKCKNINKSVTSCDVFEKWQSAESSLKEYRITGIILSESKTDAEIDIWDDRYIHIFPIGTKVEGNCNGDLTCNILWIN